jgi:2'-5' RNA ligase
MNNIKRYFISIELPQKVKKEITRIQKLLHSKNLFKGTYPNEHFLHLTIKFLGEMDEIKLSLIKNKLDEIFSDKVSLKLDKIGYFNENNIKVIWIGLKHQNLKELNKKIEEYLKDIIKQDYKKFNPHITIARVKNTSHPRFLKNTLDNLKVEPLKFDAKAFYLKQSELVKNKHEHKTLNKYLLK